MLIYMPVGVSVLEGDYVYERIYCLDDRIDACCRYGRMPTVQLVWTTLRGYDAPDHLCQPCHAGSHVCRSWRGWTNHFATVVRSWLQFLQQQHAAGALRRARLRFHVGKLTKQPCLAGAINLPARHGAGATSHNSVSSTLNHVFRHAGRLLRRRAASTNLLDLRRPPLVCLNLRDFRETIAQTREQFLVEGGLGVGEGIIAP